MSLRPPTQGTPATATFESRISSVESGIGDAASAAQDYTPSRTGSSLTIWSRTQRINPYSSTYATPTDETSNASTGLAAALARANAVGAFVEVGGFDHVINTTLDISLAPLICQGRNMTRFIGSASNLLKAQGSQAASNTATLTADAARFTEQISLSTVSGISAGTWLLLGSSGVFQTEHTDHLPGERVQVKSIASLVVTLTKPLRDTYLVADSAAVKIITDKVGVRAEGFTLHNPTPSTGTGSGIYLAHCRDLELSDIGFSQLDGQGVQLAVCQDATLAGLRFDNLTDDPDNSRFGYGILIQRATERVVASDILAEGCRHVITSDGTVGEWGVARDCRFNAIISRNAKASALDTHSHSEEFHFSNFLVVGARDFGLHHRARHSSFKNGTVTDCRGGAYMETQAIKSEIANVTFERLGWIAGRPTDTSTVWDAGATAVQLNGVEQTIRDSTISGVAGWGLTGTANRLRLRRNVFENCCLNNDGSRAGGGVGGTIPLAVVETSSAAANYYMYDNEYHADPTLAAYKGFEVTTTATIFLRPLNVTGVVKVYPVYGSGLTPFQAPTGFVGTRGGGTRVDEAGAIQSRLPFTLTTPDALLGGAAKGNHATSGLEYVEFADAATQTAVYLLRIPYEAAFDGSKISIRPQWSSPGTSGNVRWQVKGAVVTANTDLTVAPTTAIQTTSAVSATANGNVQVPLMDFGTSLTATPDRSLLLHVQRLGADAADTLANVARLHELEVFVDKG